MTNALVIVESPAKAKTLERYLGKGYKVYASYGHVRDLLAKEGAVDTDNDFAVKWAPVEKNQKYVKQIANAMKQADTLYLATDPDREGEAISWHLYQMLSQLKCLENKKVSRVVFYEVTKRAVNEAITHPRELSQDLVNAQQTRLILDYLVGFNLSPLLWRKIHQGLSAGRVQSPALRLISEREQAIRDFKPQEYWTIESDLSHKEKSFRARLITWKNEKLKQFTLNNESQTQEIKVELSSLAGKGLLVQQVEHKQRKRHPAPPFITSTLQQEGVRKLGFSSRHTMSVAQQLYEGISTGGDLEGLITYMRTDSVHLANEGITDIRKFITEKYGKKMLPESPRHYKTKSKNAQEAHEAIRPTSVQRTPEKVKKYLNQDQYRLYELIWKRAVACQMTPATIDMVAVDMECGEGNVFRANGSVITEPGFMEVYQEGKDESGDEEDKTAILPEIKKGEYVDLKTIHTIQHFTEPPPRYTEASLVKTLEEYGIGRPSTYASIIQTLQNRKYVELEKRRFILTDLGKTVNAFLTEHFQTWVNYDFTAKLEEALDEISRGEKPYLPILREFWQELAERITEKAESVSRSDVLQRRILGIDPDSGKEVSVRIGRYGPFAQIGTREDEEKPRFASLQRDQRVDTITLEQALRLFDLPRDLGNTDEGEDIVVSIGRFGPYVRYGSQFVSLKKTDDPYVIDKERALELIAEKKESDKKRQIKVFEEEGITIMRVRFGAMVSDGKVKVRIPKDQDPEKLSLSECVELLAKGKKKPAKKKVTKKTTKKTAKKTTKKTTKKKLNT